MANRRQGKAKSRINAFGPNINSVGPTVLRLLALTDKTMTDIAKRTGLDPNTVSGINKRYGIRPPEEVMDIGVKAASSKRGDKRRITRKKVNHFSIQQKNDLLRQHEKAIFKIAGRWWKSKAIRTKFGGNSGDFLKEIKKFVFEQLDYYSPEVKGRGGRTATPFTWMFSGAQMACRRLYADASKTTGEKQMPTDGDDLPISQTTEIKTTKEQRKSLDLATMRWIPLQAKTLLRTLGLDPDYVAKIGIGGIKKQIIKVAGEKKTGLSGREKKVVEMILSGKSEEKIGKDFSIRRQSVNLIKLSAARKIRQEIERRKSRMAKPNL